MGRVPVRSADAGSDARQRDRYRRRRRHAARVRAGGAWRSSIYRRAARRWPGDPGAAWFRLQTLHDLKGKKVAFGRGSSAHNLTIAALEKARLTYSDIQPIYLGPADAGAAFERGAIDAWTIWDPYYALFETRPGVRVLAKSTDITEQNSFFMASRAYVEANASITAKVVGEFPHRRSGRARIGPNLLH